jgi:hypothetical protein
MVCCQLFYHWHLHLPFWWSPFWIFGKEKDNTSMYSILVAWLVDARLGPQQDHDFRRPVIDLVWHLPNYAVSR